MRSITITEEQVKQYKLPAKAVGDWSIVEKGDGYSLLHRLKKDGTLGSDRPNNKIKIDSEVLNKLSASDTKAITGKTENGDTVVIDAQVSACACRYPFGISRTSPYLPLCRC